MEDNRTCTCHPDDSPPMPCARKYALQDCVLASTRHANWWQRPLIRIVGAPYAFYDIEPLQLYIWRGQFWAV